LSHTSFSYKLRKFSKLRLATGNQLAGVDSIVIELCLVNGFSAMYHSFIHSGDLYSASSRANYSEALPAQPRPKKQHFKKI